MDKKLTILVNSCDKNEDLWEVFFTMLKKKWEDCPFKIIFNTETKPYYFNGFDIQSTCVCKNKSEEELINYEWTDRLKDNLEKIDTKYTLFLLEDFYLDNKVDNKKIESLLNTLDKIKNFGKLSLMDDGPNYPSYYKKKLNLFKVHRIGSWKITATAAIWNTNYLKKVVFKGEDPWEFEINSSEREFYSNKKFYAICNANYDNLETPLFFNITKTVFRGKWTTQAIKFLTSEGIDVDFSKRGSTDIYSSDKKVEKTPNLKLRHGACPFIFGLNVLIDRFIRRPIRKLKNKNNKT